MLKTLNFDHQNSKFLPESLAATEKTTTFAARMDTSSPFKIILRDLPDDGESRQWHLDDSFFKALDQQVIEHGDLDATLRVKQASGAFELTFCVKGDIQIPCDRCLELMTQPIDTEATLKARLGDHFEDDGDVITVPTDDAEFDVRWNLYEIIALAIPIHHVHTDGQCPTDIENYLTDDDSVDDDAKETATSTNRPTDSRWDALKALLDTKDKDNK